MKPTVSNRSRAGFTLAELLVVCGVVLAVLIPLGAVVHKAYRKGQALECMTNLRQIAQVFRCEVSRF